MKRFRIPTRRESGSRSRTRSEVGKKVADRQIHILPPFSKDSCSTIRASSVQKNEPARTQQISARPNPDPRRRTARELLLLPRTLETPSESRTLELFDAIPKCPVPLDNQNSPASGRKRSRTNHNRQG